jgi:hypothetical protein
MKKIMENFYWVTFKLNILLKILYGQGRDYCSWRCLDGKGKYLPQGK